MSARNGHFAVNESSLRVEKTSFALRSPTAFAIGLVPAQTDDVPCRDAYCVRRMMHNALGVKQVMQTSKMRTGLHPSMSFLADAAGKV